MITEKTFEFLVEYITARVVELLIIHKQIGLEEALVLFHNSETFEKLSNKSTDLYIESPQYVYDILEEELRNGTLRGMTE